MERKYTNRRFLDLLNQKVMIFDGAMGTNLQAQNLTSEDFGGEKMNGCIDYLVISHPQSVEKVHRSFLDVGVDVIETCTFRSNRITLKEYGLENRTGEINQKAAELARRITDGYSREGQPRFVAGSIGPSGKLPSLNDPELSNNDFDQLADVFREQATGLIEGGVDLLVVETSQDILEVRATLEGIQQAFSETGRYLPIQAQVTLDTTGRMLLGTDIGAVLVILAGLPIDVIGLNCSTGPDYMREPIRFLGEQSPLPVSCIPNAGLPLNVDGQAVYPLEPLPYAETMLEFVQKYGVNVVGGCCGTTQAHLALLVETLRGKKQSIRTIPSTPHLASSVQSVGMIQDPAPFLIGERLNTQGSRKFKELLLAENFEGMLSIARDQINNGAHGLDLCVAVTERSDEKDLMRRLVKTISPAVRTPLIIDSTELEVIETALKTAPGRSLINSTNLESGQSKAEKIFELAKKFNAAVIALTIDEQGMAKIAERKLEVAKRIFHLAVDEYGLAPHDLVFDALTFTLATGDPEFNNSAQETIQGIRLIKSRLPGVLTSLGVSNVSFGLTLPARAILNSVMLFHSVQAGLDMAIVNPAQVTPYPEIPEDLRRLADDLIFNRNSEALQNYIDFFQGKPEVDSKLNNGRQSPLEGLSPSQRLHWRILHRVKDDVEKDIEILLEETPNQPKSQTAVQILNTVLLPAMKEVGDKFGSGELILPFVLQSAEVMKRSVTYLENYLEKKQGISKGLVVLATVYGDVHDIGKNLVKTILSNNGYEVVDLGKQVPAETIISKAVELKADAIGLSALLVSTSKQMPVIVNELGRRGLNFPVLIGGAAINRKFGRRILRTESGDFYQPGVFYCKDAFEGLATMDSLAEPKSKVELIDRLFKESEMELQRAPKIDSIRTGTQDHSLVKPASFIPQVSVWGPRLVKSMPFEDVFKFLSKNELFRLSWGAKNTHGDDWTKLQADFEKRLEGMKHDALKESWITPQAEYGYWPCQSDGNDLVVYDPGSLEKKRPMELTRFAFPRQSIEDLICVADYFAPVESGRMDVVAFQVVSVGKQASERFDQLQSTNNYTEAYFSHGFSVQMAEATAEFLHHHIRRELGLLPGQGKRYSWGYPAIPDLSDHTKVFQLLPVEKELGMSLSPAFQLIPEQSTAAIIVHHPSAKYFNIGESRIEQLMK